MEQDNSLKKSIEILAEITRKYIQKLYNLENFSIVIGRYGWTLKKKSVLPPNKPNY